MGRSSYTLGEHALMIHGSTTGCDCFYESGRGYDSLLVQPGGRLAVVERGGTGGYRGWQTAGRIRRDHAGEYIAGADRCEFGSSRCDHPGVRAVGDERRAAFEKDGGPGLIREASRLDMAR